MTRLVTLLSHLLLCLVALAIPPAVGETQPHAPTAAEPAAWWISPEGIALGPYDVPQLVELASRGGLATDTPVWRPGWAEWRALGETPALADVALAIAASGGQQAADTTADYLIGIWLTDGSYYADGVRWQISYRYSYRADGGFSAVETARKTGADQPTSVVALKGRYDITITGDQRFKVVHKPEGWEDLPYSFRIIDQDTMENTVTGLLSHRQR